VLTSPEVVGVILVLPEVVGVMVAPPEVVGVASIASNLSILGACSA
jgi:hypothetical protein